MKYLTIDCGKDYREIAKIMTERGYKMNHATARNILFVGMKKFFKNLSYELKLEKNPNINSLLKNPEVHDILIDVLHENFAKTENFNQETIEEEKNEV